MKREMRAPCRHQYQPANASQVQYVTRSASRADVYYVICTAHTTSCSHGSISVPSRGTVWLAGWKAASQTEFDHVPRPGERAGGRATVSFGTNQRRYRICGSILYPSGTVHYLRYLKQLAEQTYCTVPTRVGPLAGRPAASNHECFLHFTFSILLCSQARVPEESTRPHALESLTFECSRLVALSPGSSCPAR